MLTLPEIGGYPSKDYFETRRFSPCVDERWPFKDGGGGGGGGKKKAGREPRQVEKPRCGITNSFRLARIFPLFTHARQVDGGQLSQDNAVKKIFSK